MIIDKSYKQGYKDALGQFEKQAMQWKPLQHTKSGMSWADHVYMKNIKPKFVSPLRVFKSFGRV